MLFRSRDGDNFNVRLPPELGRNKIPPSCCHSDRDRPARRAAAASEWQVIPSQQPFSGWQAQHYCHDHNRKASKTNERIHLLPERNLVNLFASDGYRRTGEQGITRDKCSQKGSPDLKNLKQKISGSNLVYGCSHTGNRTPVCWVKTSYPDR